MGSRVYAALVSSRPIPLLPAHRVPALNYRLWRWVFRPAWGVPLFYALLLVVIYAPVTLLGRTLQAPAYYRLGLVPTTVPAAHSPTFDVDLATPAYYEWPTNILIGRIVRAGELPLWNPYQGAGAPLATQYSSRAFFPYQLLQDIAPVATWDLFTLGRLWIAGTLTFFFLRSTRLSTLSAVTGGLLYMLSGVFTWFGNLEQMANVAMVTPGLLLAVDGFGRSRIRRAIAFTGVAIALVLLGGQPETALFSLSLAVTYGVYRLACSRTIREAMSTIAGALLAGTIGLALAAPLLLPFLDTVRTAHNIHPPGGSIAMQGATSPLYSLAITVPTFFEHDSPDRVLPDNGIWDMLGGYTGMAAPTIVVLALATLAIPGQRRARGLLLCFAIFACVMLAKNFGQPWAHQLGRLPLLDQAWSQRWGGPAWTFAVACAAAAGIDCIRDMRRSVRAAPEISWRWRVRVLFVALVLFGSTAAGRLTQLVYDYRTTLPAGAAKYLAVSGWLGLMIAIAIAAAVTLLIAQYLRSGRVDALVALVGLAGLELWYLLPRGYGSDERTLMLAPLALGGIAVALIAWSRPRTAVPFVVLAFVLGLGIDATALHRLPARANPLEQSDYPALVSRADFAVRISGVDGFLMPNFASAAGLYDVHYITALEPESFHQFRSRFLQQEPVFDEASSSLWFTGLPDQDVLVGNEGVRRSRAALEDIAAKLPYYSLLGVRYLVGPPGLRPPAGSDLHPSSQDSNFTLLENPSALPRAFVVHHVTAVSDSKDALDWLDQNVDRLGTAAVVETTLDTSSLDQYRSSPATIRRLTANTVEIDTELYARGLLVLTDTYDAGWRVTVDGREATVYRTDGAFRGVALDPGQHRVVFRYRPAGFYRGVALATLGLVVLAAVVVWPQRRQGSGGPPLPP